MSVMELTMWSVFFDREQKEIERKRRSSSGMKRGRR